MLGACLRGMPIMRISGSLPYAVLARSAADARGPKRNRSSLFGGFHSLIRLKSFPARSRTRCVSRRVEILAGAEFERRAAGQSTSKTRKTP